MAGIPLLLLSSFARAQFAPDAFSLRTAARVSLPSLSVTGVASAVAPPTVGGMNTISRVRERAATEGSTVPYRYPPIDPAKALAGAALLTALKKGGFVLYMRHTQTGTVTPECAQSNLTPAGERDARFVGESIKTLRIPIGQVLSSPVCRVLDTAKLVGLGEPKLSNDLANQAMPAGFNFDSARRKRIAELPASGKNTLLVSHLQSGKMESEWIYLDFGEIVVYQPGGKNESEALARIRADDWYDLVALEYK